MLRPLNLPASIKLPAVNWQTLLLLAVLFLAGITQAVNMLAFPFYDNVEGLNMANAWSLLHEGRLSPYTYNYENPPMGWVLLATWMAISSIIPEPETILSSGRVFMLVVHILTVLVVYGITRKFQLSPPFAVLVVLVFSLSPLVTILQRRILLENLMTLLALISLYYVLGNGRTLLHYAVSAFALGLAFITNVAALSFFPAIFLIVLKRSHSSHRRFVLAFWLGIVISLYLGFPLHALLKNELFPAGVLFGGSHPHVSLYETQSIQLERVSSQEFLRSDSSFIYNLNRWTDLDEAASDAGLMIVGLFSVGVVLIATIRMAHLRPLALLLVLYGLHLATLKRLFDPDIIPLLPLLAISVGVAAQAVIHLIQKHIPQREIRYPLYTVLAILFISVFSWTYMRKFELYGENQTSMQFDAVRWVSQHAPPESLVVTDNYAFVDLRRALPDTHYYWVVDVDPQVRSEVFANSWCSVDYMITTPQMLQDMDRNQLRLLSMAYRNSITIQMYENNGWPIDIREVNKHNCNIPFP